MGLDSEYPSWFERIWDAYPTTKKDHPKCSLRRSNKKEAFEVAKKNPRIKENVDELVSRINDYIHNDIHFQKNSEFGPCSLQKFLRQEMYSEPPRKKPSRGPDKYDAAEQRLAREKEAELRRRQMKTV